MLTNPTGRALFINPVAQYGINMVLPSSMRRTPTRRRKAAKASAPKRTKAKARKLKFGSPAWQKKYKVGKFSKKRK